MFNFNLTTLEKKGYYEILKDIQKSMNELKVKYHFVLKHPSRMNIIDVSLDKLSMSSKMDVFQKIFENNLLDVPSTVYYTEIAQDFVELQEKISELLNTEVRE